MMMERELQFSKTREKELLEILKNLQDKESVNANVPPIPNLEMVAEINELKQTLDENNNNWEKRLQQVLEI